jgi:hypothetical protein
MEPASLSKLWLKMCDAEKIWEDKKDEMESYK